MNCNTNETKVKRNFKGVWIPKEIWDDDKLSVTEKCFLTEIDSLDNEHGCFAGNEYFSKFFNLSKTRCSKIISQLEKNSYIYIKYQRDQKFEKVTRRVIKCVKRYADIKRCLIEFDVLENPNLRGFKGVWIPKQIWINDDLTLTEKCFYVEIHTLDNEYGCYASNDYFSKFFTLSKHRCGEIIKTLEQKGYVNISYKYLKNTKHIDRRIIKCLVNFEGGYKKKNDVLNEQTQFQTNIDVRYSKNATPYSKNATPYSKNATPYSENDKDNKTTLIKQPNKKNNKTLSPEILKNFSEGLSNDDDFFLDDDFDSNSDEHFLNIIDQNSQDNYDVGYEDEVSNSVPINKENVTPQSVNEELSKRVSKNLNKKASPPENLAALKNFFNQQIWERYPKSHRVGKEIGFRAFRRAVKSGTSKDSIVSGLNLYLAAIKHNHTDPRYIKRLDNWMNSESWLNPNRHFTDPYTQQLEKSQKRQYYYNKRGVDL